jgi:hypothetical protein
MCMTWLSKWSETKEIWTFDFDLVFQSGGKLRWIVFDLAIRKGMAKVVWTDDLVIRKNGN